MCARGSKVGNEGGGGEWSGTGCRPLLFNGLTGGTLVCRPLCFFFSYFCFLSVSSHSLCHNHSFLVSECQCSDRSVSLKFLATVISGAHWLNGDEAGGVKLLK